MSLALNRLLADLLDCCWARRTRLGTLSVPVVPHARASGLHCLVSLLCLASSI
jgi:hypothetical protein